MVKKDLQSLIRLRKWEVDEKQRGLAVLLRKEEAIIERQVALEEEIRREVAHTSEVPAEQQFTFAAYLERCGGYREELEDTLNEVRRLGEVAQEELSEAFRQLKPIEETQKLRDVEGEKQESRQEQEDLDEVGLNLNRRRKQRIL